MQNSNLSPKRGISDNVQCSYAISPDFMHIQVSLKDCDAKILIHNSEKVLGICNSIKHETGSHKKNTRIFGLENPFKKVINSRTCNLRGKFTQHNI